MIIQINEAILSEIDHNPNFQDDIKKFLRWLVAFERENSDKEMFSYKSEISNEITRITTPPDENA